MLLSEDGERFLGSSALQGRVHVLGRRTKDGFSCSFRRTADGERRTSPEKMESVPIFHLTLFPRTGPCSWTKDEGRLFALPTSGSLMNKEMEEIYGGFFGKARSY